MSYKLPELITFINKSINKEWTYCEKYMLVDGDKIESRLPLGKKVSDGLDCFVNGIIIKKVLD